MQRHDKRIALLYRGPQGEGKDSFTSFVPMGLFNVLKSLLDARYQAELHNLSALPRAGLGAAISGLSADAFLISAFFGCHREALILAGEAKKSKGLVPVILGGPLSVLDSALLAHCDALDFVIRGEGEASCIHLLDHYFAGNGDLDSIPGLVRRSATGYRSNPPRLLDDIDRYFFLPSELLPHCHGVHPDNWAVLISSRGCPFHCAFCSSTVLWRNRVRHHSVDLLLRYLLDLRRTTGAFYFSLRDENFLVNRGQVEQFCNALAASNLHYLWNAQGSPRLLDDALAQTLAAAGCDQLQMGIETVIPRLRTLLNKQGDSDDARQAIGLLRRHCIRPFGYFIYGMGESREEGEQTISFLKKSGLLDAVASPLVLYPGTRLAEGIAPQQFLSSGELFFHTKDSYRLWKNKYEQAIAALYNSKGFTREELYREKKPNLVTSVARHFYHFNRGELPQAKEVLLAMQSDTPDNPWSYELLTRYYSELGKRKEAKVMASALRALLMKSPLLNP